VRPEQRDEISASVAARKELGPDYDEALAEGLVERIGEEIDKRVDARLRATGQQSALGGLPPAPQAYRARGAGSGFAIALVSLIFGTGATSVVLGNTGNAVVQAVLVVLIWVAIAVINVANARRR
jgi:hypothetical protein